MTNDIQASDRTILTGRIYPTILNCVNNRYKIIAGYIAISGFLLVVEKLLSQLVSSSNLFFLPSIFSAFVILNSINYWFNAKEQIKLEKGETSVSFKSTLNESCLDIIFSAMMLVFIWGGYCFLRSVTYSA